MIQDGRTSPGVSRNTGGGRRCSRESEKEGKEKRMRRNGHEYIGKEMAPGTGHSPGAVLSREALGKGGEQRG